MTTVNVLLGIAIFFLRILSCFMVGLYTLKYLDLGQMSGVELLLVAIWALLMANGVAPNKSKS
jgi:hypothetical protein